MLAEQMAGLIASAPLRTLDDLSRDVWKALSNGLMTDDQAQELAEAIHARRSRNRAEPGGGHSVVPVVRAWSYFPPKRPQRSPDRERSLQRRRQLAASGPLPPALACRFTTGELAVLRIVADEVRMGGCCALTLPEIAARAGVCSRTARNAIKEAARLGLVTVEERRRNCRPNLSNVVRIVSRDWSAWIKRGGGGKKPQATDNQGFQERGLRTGMPLEPPAEPMGGFSLLSSRSQQNSGNRRLRGSHGPFRA